MPGLQTSAIRASASIGLATLLSAFSLASSAVAIPIKLPDWLRPNSTNNSNPSPTPNSIIFKGTPTPGAQPTTTTPAPPPVAATSTTTGQSGFQCQFVNGQQTVMYLPQSQTSLAYAWAVPRSLGGGWTAQKRCVEISRRLESYRPDGLIELQTGQENGYNTVCVTTQKTPGCRIVFTVPNGQDPNATRDQVFQNIAYAESGQQTQGVNTLVQQGNNGSLRDLVKSSLGTSSSAKPALTPRTSSGGIDLRPFLDQADGGTGSQLKKGVPRR